MWTLRETSARTTTWRITSVLGRSGECPQLANNSGKVPLHQCGRGKPPLHNGQVTFPRGREGFRQRASHPKLGIGGVNQLPPGIFPFDIRGLKRSQAEFLFAKAEKVFQIEAAAIALVNRKQSQFVTPLAHNEKPKGTFASLIALFVIAHNLNESS